MPVTFPCRDCGRLLRVSDTHLGKKVRCPGCGGVVPAPESGGEPDDRFSAAVTILFGAIVPVWTFVNSLSGGVV
jgi:hypothetical protein